MLFGPPVNYIMSVSTTTGSVISYHLINVMIVIFKTVDIRIAVKVITNTTSTSVVVGIIYSMIFCPRGTPVLF
jgi:hypothetical protein